MFNLILAVIWFTLAFAAFVLPLLRPELERLLLVHPFGQTMSVGWVMLVLALFNFGRWYADRSARAERRSRLEADKARYNRADARPEVARNPDPAFDFSETAARGEDGTESPPPA